MKAFILAAGEGTRMRPLTANIPKPLLPVAGKPFLMHTLESLRENKIGDITILIGWRGRRVREYLGDGSKIGLNIGYEEQERRLGTAHAIGLAKKHVGDTFLCVNGDVVLTPKSIEGFLSFGKKKGTSVALAKVTDTSNLGVVELEDDVIKSIEEKPKFPKSNLINAGMYLFEKNIFELIEKTPQSSRGEYEITDTLQMLMEKEEVHGNVLAEEWIDVGRPWDLLKANQILLKNVQEENNGEVRKEAVIENNVQIGEGTIVKNGSHIIGPTIIGKNCEIGPNCLIRPSTYIGEGCKVGSASEVKNSIVMDGSHVPHHNYVGDSVIGERCNLGSGTKIANLRLDEKNIMVSFKGQIIDTGLRKLGAIIGDDVKTGINSSIDVGAIIGENTFIGPGAVARGVIAPNSRVF
ncbi:MAG: NTP transferase domain-containing protein [Methanobacteriota archaeon]|nr:MAG: NTP transferase domain-containing protein [Euryarchaeota archaeon]